MLSGELGVFRSEMEVPDDSTSGSHECRRHSSQAGSTISHDLISVTNTQEWPSVPPYSCSRLKSVTVDYCGDAGSPAVDLYRNDLVLILSRMACTCIELKLIMLPYFQL